MKRFISILCAISLVFCVMCIAGIAFADANSKGVNVNFSTATDQELREAIECIQNELDSRANNRSGAGNKNEIGVKKSNSDGVSLTVLTIKESNGSKYYKPESGNIFVFLELEIENNSNETISINSTFGFDAICDDYPVDYSFAAECAVDNGLSSLDLKPGRKIKGWKAFELPKNWKELILTFNPSLWDSRKEIEVFVYK